jgi:copper chaperone CopZ
MAVVGAYKAVERALSNLSGVSTEQADDAINRTAIESAVDEQGLTAVADGGVLRAAIDQEKLDRAVDIDELRDEVAESIASDDQ